MSEIDKFRHKYFPDDIQLYNVDEKGNEELVWGRIEDCSLENKVVVCNLLSDSIFNNKYKSNSLVIAKYEKKKKEENVIIKSSVRKKEKNAEWILCRFKKCYFKIKSLMVMKLSINKRIRRI